MMKLQHNPKLRFSHYEGEWNRNIFGNYVIDSAFGPRFSSDLYGNEGEIATLRTTDMDLEGNICYETMPLANLEYYQIKDHVLESNDIVISRSGTIGITGVFKNHTMKVVPGAFLIRFRVDRNKISPHFIKLQFNSEKGRNILNKLSAGGVQKNLTGTSVKQLEIVIPSLPEQQKIASFLSAVDEKIQQLFRKRELLEQYKKGVMQQLFSGKLRFKDENGKNYADWEEKKLGEVAKFRRGSFPQPYGLPKWYDDENGMPFIQVYDVDNNMLLKNTTKNKISKLGATQSVFVKKGTLVITIQGSIGRIAKTQYDAYVDRTLLIFQSYKLPTDIDYFKYVVFLLFEIEKTKAPGGTIKTITKEVLTDFKIPIPCVQEQQKIANFLSNIDIKIENTNQEINNMQGFKKGLLQQMFV